MDQEARGSDPRAELRRRAEQALADRAVDVDQLASHEAQRLIYDLQVHQIELEMQNEELRRTQEELADSRDRYFDLYDLAPSGYLTLSEQGLILQANLTIATLLGVERGRSSGSLSPLSSAGTTRTSTTITARRSLIATRPRAAS